MNESAKREGLERKAERVRDRLVKIVGTRDSERHKIATDAEQVGAAGPPAAGVALALALASAGGVAYGVRRERQRTPYRRLLMSIKRVQARDAKRVRKATKTLRRSKAVRELGPRLLAAAGAILVPYVLKRVLRALLRR